MDVNGKVAVVTGGASGIGQAVARRIAGAGGKVVIFDLNEEAGNAMVAELGADHCVFANVNVVDEASVKSGIEAAVAGFGAIHVCVNCAGIGNAAKTLGKDGPVPPRFVEQGHLHQLDRQLQCVAPLCRSHGEE